MTFVMQTCDTRFVELERSSEIVSLSIKAKAKARRDERRDHVLVTHNLQHSLAFQLECHSIIPGASSFFSSHFKCLDDAEEKK